MCNSDITVQILEKAIEEESNAKKGAGFLGGVFGRGSPKKSRLQNASSGPQTRPPIASRSTGISSQLQVVQQEMPPPDRRNNDNDGSQLRNIDSVGNTS